MLFLPLSKCPRRVVRYARCGTKGLICRVRTRLGIHRFAVALDMSNRRIIVGEFTIVGARNAGLAENFHPLFAIELPRGTFGITTDDPATARAEGVHVGHIDAVALKDRQVSPIHVRPPVRDTLDEALADRPRPMVEFPDENPDLMT